MLSARCGDQQCQQNIQIWLLLFFPTDVDLPHPLFIACGYGITECCYVQTLFGISNKMPPNKNIHYKLCKTRRKKSYTSIIVFFSGMCINTWICSFLHICWHFQIAFGEQILYLIFSYTCLRNVYERTILVLEKSNQQGKFSRKDMNQSLEL